MHNDIALTAGFATSELLSRYEKHTRSIDLVGGYMLVKHLRMKIENW